MTELEIKQAIAPAAQSLASSLASTISPKVAVMGGIVGFLGTISSEMLMAWGGIIIGLLGWLTTIYYKQLERRDRLKIEAERTRLLKEEADRKKELHNAQMKAYDPKDPSTDRRGRDVTVLAKDAEEMRL